MSSRFILPFADVGSGIKPSSGAQLFFFATGTSTPKDTFSDQLSTPTVNSNPVVADSTGVFGDIFISGTYKVVLKDKNNVQIWEADPVTEYAIGSFDANLINDLSQAYEFPTVAAYKAFATAFPVGKVINLLDRRAEFTVIAGTGTATGNGIIASDEVSQSITLTLPNSNPIAWGADGGGVVNDYTVLQEMFTSTEPEINITDDKIFSTESELTSSIENRLISGKGKIIFNGGEVRMMSITGDNTTIDGPEFDGNNKSNRGVWNSAAKPTIKNCTFRNFYGATVSVRAIDITTLGEGWVESNKFYDLDAVTGEPAGSDKGAVRAIVLRSTVDREEEFFIENNYIHTVLGNEGDAILVQCITGGVPYQKGLATVRNNTIKNMTRRAIKIQASDNTIERNKYETTLGLLDVPISSAPIAIFGAGNNTVKNNTLNSALDPYGIVIDGAGVVVSGNEVSENTINSSYNDGAVPNWGAKSFQRAIAMIEQRNFSVSDNTSYGAVLPIEIADSTLGTIEDNKVYEKDNFSSVETNALTTTGSSHLTIKGNTGYSDTNKRTYFIELVSPYSTVSDNHVDYPEGENYAAVRFPSTLATNSLIIGNTNSSLGFAVVSGTTPSLTLKIDNYNLALGA